ATIDRNGSYRPAGTPHKAPPLDARGFPIDEAVAGARYLCRTKGVRAESILLDRWSMDTVGRIIECGRIEDAADGSSSLVTSANGSVHHRYFPVADVGMTDEMLFARASRERESLALLQSEVLPNIKTPE
ncbi:hypothetical protein FOZ63_020011, partial [Perkinsus olseni]